MLSPPPWHVTGNILCQLVRVLTRHQRDKLFGVSLRGCLDFVSGEEEDTPQSRWHCRAQRTLRECVQLTGMTMSRTLASASWKWQRLPSPSLCANAGSVCRKTRKHSSASASLTTRCSRYLTLHSFPLHTGLSL